MGVQPWSPLAGGFLSGKYRRGDTAETGRLGEANPFGDSKFVDRNRDVLDVVKAIASEMVCSPAQGALAWMVAKSGVSSTLISVRSVEQLKGSLAAASLRLDDGKMERLNEVSAPAASFSAALASPAIRRMIFGGQDVCGWGE